MKGKGRFQSEKKALEQELARERAEFVTRKELQMKVNNLAHDYYLMQRNYESLLHKQALISPSFWMALFCFINIMAQIVGYFFH